MEAEGPQEAVWCSAGLFQTGHRGWGEEGGRSTLGCFVKLSPISCLIKILITLPCLSRVRVRI